ncbi:hypothetical protein [uncultured Aquimarina sp.]|uniref:hypothetical protein n=1 Tax=uncultured Aquimarina sp. TaxID=575652 RepID=UPI0026385DDB|nr:hypothetical protein [uncultured Aquimarina sp.]
MKKNKYKLLKKGVIYDLIGMASLAIPFVGPFLDLIWAPYAAKKMMDMYPGKKGKIASVITFIEEIIPGTDIIPTFTIMWLYTFVLNKEEIMDKDAKIIEVEVIS